MLAETGVGVGAVITVCHILCSKSVHQKHQEFERIIDINVNSTNKRTFRSPRKCKVIYHKHQYKQTIGERIRDMAKDQ